MASVCNDLYIYWVNRALTEEEERLFDESFIGNWVEDDFSFLFFSRDAEVIIKRLIEKNGNLRIVDQYYMTYEQWQGNLYDSIRVDRFIIIPPWHKKDIPIEDHLIPVFLDPGVVFGNCLHPSTRHCVEAISWASERHPIRRVVDLGTGTGILAIVAAKLGAEKVVACDINPLCVKTTMKNIIKNGLQGRIEAVCGRAEDIISEFSHWDLVVANLNHDVITDLIRLTGFSNNKRLVISGLLRSQWADIKNQLIKNGYDIEREWDHEMTWYTAIVTKGGVNRI